MHINKTSLCLLNISTLDVPNINTSLCIAIKNKTPTLYCVSRVNTRFCFLLQYKCFSMYRHLF